MGFHIPKRLQDKAMGWMAAHNDDEMSDGAWFATLESAGEQFLSRHKLRGDGNDMAHWYLKRAAKENGNGDT